MGMSRRQVLGLGAGAAAVGATGVGVAIHERVLPGRHRIGYWLQLDGDPVPMPTDPPGQVEYATFSTAARPGVPEPWALSVPQGMSADGLPVIVVLHGYGDDHRFPFEELGFDRYQNRVIAEGAQPFAVATLDGGHSFWHERADGVDWARVVSDGLVPQLQEKGLDTSRLGLIGYSMGGYGALRLAAEELHGRVKAVGSMATAIYPDFERCPHPDAFDDERDYIENNLQDRLHKIKDLPVHLACGVNDFYIDINRWLAKQFDPEPQTLFVRGDHESDFWRRAAPVQMRFVADRL
ncbi:alpha/beta hydrolase-fold protein [Luteococcus sp. Sow4_B9]|uniref:alpha/beta hydrolase-fold protein n=1 Tax=Luteococcus sp. Sow4_B9 TaxID=3438792 RepID=UPI003F959202